MAAFVKQYNALGGMRGMLRQLMRIKDLRAGAMVGTDENGNQYYEDYSYIFGRSRYVMYKERQPDMTTISPEWHRWIHYMCDEPPSRRPVWQPKFKLPATPTTTGSANQEYVPFNTTKPKIQEWQPPQ